MYQEDSLVTFSLGNKNVFAKIKVFKRFGVKDVSVRLC